MSTVTPETVSWLWPGKIALGKLTVITGDPGNGKSLMMADFASRVTQGRSWPDETAPCKPGGVVILTAEDGIADTLAPRLVAAGADMTKVGVLKAIKWYNDETKKVCERAFSLERDLEALEKAASRVPDCRLVVIDPLSAYLGGIDSHRDADVRSVLAPLADLAARLHVAVVCVNHLNKGDLPAMYRSSGSLAFVAAARAVFIVARDKQDRDVRVFTPLKNNLGKDRSSLTYRITEADGSPVLNWSPIPIDMDPDDVLGSERGPRGNRMIDQAKQWLCDTLANGEKPQEEVEQLASDAGIAKKTLQRAKCETGVLSRKIGFGANGVWIWRLPDQRRPKAANPPEHQTMATLAPNGHLSTNRVVAPMPRDGSNSCVQTPQRCKDA
jgi:archaellum biogenesis ATPase FlaH